MLKKNIILVLIIITCLTFFLRIYKISKNELWLDEAYSVIVSQEEIADICENLKHDTSAPVYYFLLHFWMKYFGNTEFSVRFVSLLAAVLSIPVLYLLAKECFNWQAGLISVILFAFVTFINVLKVALVLHWKLSGWTGVFNMHNQF